MPRGPVSVTGPQMLEVLLEEPDELPTTGQPSRPTTTQTWKHFLSHLTARQVASWALDALKPDLFSRHKIRSSQRPHDTTAWLDGLRGWAALSVCVFHLTVHTHEGIESCYGATLPSGGVNTTPAAWPIVRLLWSGGHFAVLVFYTISGYVLPRRLISLLHEGRQNEFVAALRSAVCRRPMRLFLPVIWSTLITLMVTHMIGDPTASAPPPKNLFLDLSNWVRETGKFLYYYREGDLATPYNYHTWTIPIELRGSMFLFVWLFALSQAPRKTRILLTMAMIWFLAFATPGAMYATFFAGMLTAELDLISSGRGAARASLPWYGRMQVLERHPLVRTGLLCAVLISALYLGSQPSEGSGSKDQVLGKCHGWVTLGNLIPDAAGDGYLDFWWFWAAWGLLLACKELSWLKRGLEGRFSQYLGKNSFALYLLHGPVMKQFTARLFYLAGVQTSLGGGEGLARLWNRWYDASWFPFTKDGRAGLEPNFLFCVVINIPVFLYVAELGTRFFDTPSVRVSRWMYIRFLQSH